VILSGITIRLRLRLRQKREVRGEKGDASI
jgi:hypothetical protein